VINDLQRQLDKNYQKRKLWFGKNKFQDQAEIFSIETKRAGMKKGDKLLEIGFGEGLFLDWAKYAGFNIAGVEINHDFYALAKKKGHIVYLGNTKEVLNDSEIFFDGIFLFDVLEHLTLEEILDLFNFFRTILREKGKIVARFPNGGSPFGRFLQNSDATHVTVLTGPKIQDIAQLAGLEVKGVYNGARTKRSGIHKNWILKWIAYGLRDLVQLVIGYLYYGENIPFDPNLTIIMGHASERS